MQKSIWAYWHQGEDEAPFLVKQCLNSWRRLNPEWTLTVLDNASADRMVDVADFKTRADIGLQAFSDILRVALLSDKGGVWIDATLYCVSPLNDWLLPRIDDDFFAFASKRKDRLMTTWFLYGTGDSLILKAWKDAIYDYWNTHRFRPQGYFTQQLMRHLKSLRKRNLISNDFWFSRFLTDTLQTYPYPVNMYLFESALSKNEDLMQSWLQRNHLFDYSAELLQNHHEMNSPCTPDSIAFLESGATPVHKLNWRQDRGKPEPGSNLEFLLAMDAHTRSTTHG